MVTAINRLIQLLCVHFKLFVFFQPACCAVGKKGRADWAYILVKAYFRMMDRILASFICKTCGYVNVSSRDSACNHSEIIGRIGSDARIFDQFRNGEFSGIFHHLGGSLRVTFQYIHIGEDFDCGGAAVAFGSQVANLVDSFH